MQQRRNSQQPIELGNTGNGNVDTNTNNIPEYKSTTKERFGLQPRYAFAETELAPGSFQFTDNNTIIFPIGRHLWSCVVEKREMNFLSRRASSSPPIVRVSADRKRLLVAETIDAKKPQLTFYDISGKNHQVLWHFSHSAKGIITACDISSDGKVVVCHIKYLEGHGRKASGIVCLWKAESKKFIAGKEVSCDISHLTINPEDSYLICAGGYKYLRYLKCVGNSLDEVPLLKRHNERSYTFTSHVWITSEVLACLTETSAVCIFVKGDMKQKIPRKEGKDTSGGNITCIESTNDGFILGTSDGYLLFYSHDKNRNYKFMKEYDTERNKEITSLSLNPMQELLAISIKDYGLVSFTCGKIGWSNDEDIKFHDCLIPCGTTVAMDISEQRQLLVTASLDNIVRIFNNIRDSRQVVQSTLQHAFDEVPLAVALHPNGLSLVLAFSKYLAYYHILRDDLKESFIFHLQVPIASSVIMHYSHEGHKLGVCTGSHLFVFSSLDFSLLQYISVQHIVKTFCWSRNDLYICAATADGAIYTWELETLRKVQDSVDKGLKYEDVVLDWGIEWKYTENLCKSSTAAKRVHLLADHQDEASLQNSVQHKKEIINNNDTDVLLNDSNNIPLSSSLLNSTKTTTINNSNNDSDDNKEQNNNNNNNKINTTRKCPNTIIASGGGNHHKLQHIDNGQVGDIKLEDKGGEGGQLRLLDADFRKMTITQLVLDTSRNVLIAGTQSGYILLLSYPFTNESSRNGQLSDCYARYAIHDGPITHLKLMTDHGVLFSNGSDGNLFIMDLGIMGSNGQFIIKHQHKIRKKDDDNDIFRIGGNNRSLFYENAAAAIRNGNNINLDSDWQEEIYNGNLDIVQVLQSEYDEVIKRAKEHELELKQLQTQATYQLRTVKDHHAEEMRLLRADMETILERKRLEVESQKAKNHQNILLNEKQAIESKKILEQSKFEITEDFEVRLHQQYQITEQYQRRLEKLQEVLVRDQQKNNNEMKTLKDEYENKLLLLENQQKEKINMLEKSKESLQSEYEEVIRQMEEEHSIEVAWLEKEADEKLRTTRETTAIARARMATMAAKFEGNQNTLSTLRIMNNEQDELLKKREDQIMQLKTEIKSGKTESKMKEVELTRKQHDLANARKSSTVLQNFIGVLEHRITELEEREQPTQRFLQQLKDQIDNMNEEFFEQTQGQQKLKHYAQKKGGEAHRLSSTVARVQHDLSRQEKRWNHLVKELKHIVHHTPTADWESALRTFYDDYIAAYSHTVDDEDRGIQNKVYNVLDRQRRHLEHSLNQMKRSVKHIDERRAAETEKAVQRNTLFLAEVNELREQNKKLEQRCKKYMSMALVSSDKGRHEGIDNGIKYNKRRPSSTDSIKNKNINNTSTIKKKITNNPNNNMNDSSSWEYQPRNSNNNNKYNRIITGSTKPLSAVSELKRKLDYAQANLENAHQKISLQKVEISHLQEGVNVALNLAHTNFSNYTSSQLSQVNDIAESISSDQKNYAALEAVAGYNSNIDDNDNDMKILDNTEYTDTTRSINNKMSVSSSVSNLPSLKDSDIKEYGGSGLYRSSSAAVLPIKKKKSRLAKQSSLRVAL